MYDPNLVDALSIVVEAYPWEELTTLLFFAGTPVNLRCALAARVEELAPDTLHDYEAAHDLAMKTARLLRRALEADGIGQANETFTPEEAGHFKVYARMLRQTLGDVEDDLQQDEVDDLFESADETARRIWERLCTV